MKKATINLGTSDDAVAYKYYKYFTKIHRKFIIIRRKTVAVALINLTEFSDYNDYQKTIKGKNSADYFSRKALKRGYTFAKIDMNEYVDDIYAIHTSKKYRQGRKMDKGYLIKQESYPVIKNHEYFGIIKDNHLVAYLGIAILNEVVIIFRILGHGDFLNDGIMYLLVNSTIGKIFEMNENKKIKYVMYDAFFGNLEGLCLFKKRLGFSPYKVKWLITK